jgi:two-component system, cell cycle sensor histidine kinase and response regulator CckA
MRVVVAQDGREAIDIFSRDPDIFDIVVLDLVMPEIDGPTAGVAIRRLRPEVPLLGASGYAAENAIEQARSAGFTSFLPKPYTMDGLLDALRAALTRPAAV